ncbi:hypothetical protein Thiowin_01280 [Thiorhodovibrio winogradskyi]|uniref:Transposase n=1 Tax=Thiorhodovibrio winogradskyi TaxID=77007 RepID=A0ABZ0S732_9GAMM|nr:hypothetical protein [Thiorhodovibrio winogradskyi]
MVWMEPGRRRPREGDVYARLLTKLEIEGQALNGRVFDILGEVFENIRLRDLLLEAIRYGNTKGLARCLALPERIEAMPSHTRRYFCKQNCA